MKPKSKISPTSDELQRDRLKQYTTVKFNIFHYKRDIYCAVFCCDSTVHLTTLKNNSLSSNLVYNTRYYSEDTDSSKEGNNHTTVDHNLMKLK